MCRVDTKCDEMKVSRRQPMKQRSMKKKKKRKMVCDVGKQSMVGKLGLKW